jgi:hypothetical protein
MAGMLANMLHLVRVRLPTQAQARFGVKAGSSEEAIVWGLSQHQQRRYGYPLSSLTSWELESVYFEWLERITRADSYIPVPGSLSGRKRDVFAWSRHLVDAREQVAVRRAATYYRRIIHKARVQDEWIQTGQTKIAEARR